MYNLPSKIMSIYMKMLYTKLRRWPFYDGQEIDRQMYSIYDPISDYTSPGSFCGARLDHSLR
jgi:hypothetical protein